jgi:hypothetical protein
MSNEQTPQPPDSGEANNPNAHLIQKAINALKQKNPSATCDFCGQKDFIIATELVALICLDAHKNSIKIGRQFPCVALFCKNCGNTKLFNAKALGVL